MIVIQHEPLGASIHNRAFENWFRRYLERNPSGKLLKSELRKLARRHWEDQHSKGVRCEPSANL